MRAHRALSALSVVVVVVAAVMAVATPATFVAAQQAAASPSGRAPSTKPLSSVAVSSAIVDPIDRVKAAAAAAIATVKNAATLYERLETNSSTLTWKGALEWCERRGKRLCQSSEYCDGRKPKQPLTGVQWAPVSDAHNEWVFIGDKTDAWVCDVYRNISVLTSKEKKSSTPSWGLYDIAKEYKGNFMCCDMALEVLDTKSPTWDQAQRFCEASGKRLCSAREYCPLGEQKTPAGGLLTQAMWAAVYDRENEWVALGWSFPTRHMCRTHSQIAGVAPKWGTTNSSTPWRGVAKCCRDGGFDHVRGRLTWGESQKYCEKSGKTLCSLKEICPFGAKRPPTGGERPEGVWVPVVDPVPGPRRAPGDDDDALVELAAREHEEMEQAKPMSADAPSAQDWVYVGHGRTQDLCRVYSDVHSRSMLSRREEDTDAGRRATFVACCAKPSEAELAAKAKKTTKRTVLADDGRSWTLARALPIAMRELSVAVAMKRVDRAVKNVTEVAAQIKAETAAVAAAIARSKASPVGAPRTYNFSGPAEPPRPIDEATDNGASTRPKIPAITVARPEAEKVLEEKRLEAKREKRRDVFESRVKSNHPNIRTDSLVRSNEVAKRRRDREEKASEGLKPQLVYGSRPSQAVNGSAPVGSAPSPASSPSESASSAGKPAATSAPASASASASASAPASAPASAASTPSATTASAEENAKPKLAFASDGVAVCTEEQRRACEEQNLSCCNSVVRPQAVVFRVKTGEGPG